MDTNLNMANVASLLQYAGMINVILGILIFSKRPPLGCALSITGNAFLAAWCLTIEPIPWGVFVVQWLCIAAWSRNWRKAPMRIRKGGGL